LRNGQREQKSKWKIGGIDQLEARPTCHHRINQQPVCRPKIRFRMDG